MYDAKSVPPEITTTWSDEFVQAVCEIIPCKPPLGVRSDFVLLLTSLPEAVEALPVVRLNADDVAVDAAKPPATRAADN